MRSLRLLTEKERSTLEQKLKQTRDVGDWRRIFVILSYDDGYTVEELAKLTRLSPWTIDNISKSTALKIKLKMTRVEEVPLNSLNCKKLRFSRIVSLSPI